MSPRVADGVAVIESLNGTPFYPKIKSIYRKAWVAQSCIGDLRQAEIMLSALSMLLGSSRQKGTDERAATEAALLAQAVQLYARATYTTASKGDRGSIDIRSELTDQQRLDHHHLTQVRVKAMAHVYPDEAIYDNRWHKNNLLLVETSHGWRVGCATQRIQFSQSTFEALRRQAPVAEAILLQIFARHTDALTHVLNEAGIPIEMFESAALDLEQLMGPSAARAAIDGIDQNFVAYSDK